MNAANPLEPGAFEIARDLERRAITPLELTRAMLDRIDRLNPAINAYVEVFREPALADAATATAEIAAG